MKTPAAKFGGLAGADTGPGVDNNSAAFWQSFTSAPLWSQRVGLIDPTSIPNTSVSTSPGIGKLNTLAARPEFQSISKAIRFGIMNNMGLAQVDPIKGTSGHDPITTVDTIGTGDDALVWHDTNKPLNARWKVSVVANALPNILPISVFKSSNEPDGTSHRISAYASLPANVGKAVDMFSNQNCLDKPTVLSRLLALMKVAYEELRTDKRQFTIRRHASPVAAFSCSGGIMRGSAGDAFNAYDYFNYNNGEILKYCDVIDQHFHNFQSTFDISGVPAGRKSPWHFWTALQQGQALAGTGKIHPIFSGEWGVMSGHDDPSGIEQLPVPFRKSWNDPPTAGNRATRHLLKTWRLGMSSCTFFYWGFSHVFLYQQNATTPDYGHTFCPANNNFIPLQPQWDALRALFNPENYYVTGRWPWSLPITAKPFTDYTSDATKATVGFHYAPTWAVLGDLTDAEKSDPASTTVPANHITFTAPVAGQGNQLNRACRPVILPGHGRYKITCSFSGNTGTARLIARGYDACDGLANTTASSTAASGSLSTTFTTNPHNVKNFPNLPKVAVVLECTKAADYSDVTIAPA